jgi:hypothetical protein
MKITNWCRSVATKLVAAGVLLPSAAYALDIPLGDPSFEDYVVPAVGYAYSDEYRPTSAWVDDLDNPGGGTQYVEDDGFSHWLYQGYQESRGTLRDRLARGTPGSPVRRKSRSASSRQPADAL